MTISNSIIAWNKDRCIPQKFDLVGEAAMIAEELTELLQAKDNNALMNALCDIRVLVEGAMWKAGYDVDIAMDETLKEIEDRGGYFDVVSGKWLKTIKPGYEYYVPDYDKAKFK